MERSKTLLLVLGAGALAVGGLGVHLTVGYQAFPRSGSLIVIYGVALAGREIFRAEKSLSEHESRVDRLEAAYLDAIERGKRQGDEVDFSKLAENLREYRSSRISRVGQLINIEIGIVCLGTLIWGFGDLIGP